MGYRSNLGCLWLLLLILIVGGSPLLIGVLRLFAGFVLIALVGGMVLTWWIRRQAVLQYSQARGTHTRRFVELLVGLLVRLAESDGELNRREVAVIRQFFQTGLGYQGEELLWVRDLIKESRGASAGIEEICSELSSGYGLQERFIVVQVLTRVAQADGVVSATESRLIEEVARRLGLSPFVGGFGFDPGRETAARAGADVDEALAVLGLRRGAGADDIKRAWRQLSMENHPDRVTHLGEEFRKLADERMRRINAAYESLKAAGLAA